MTIFKQMVVMKVRVTPDSGNDPTVMKNRVTTDGDNYPTVIAKGMMCRCTYCQPRRYIFIIIIFIIISAHKETSDIHVLSDSSLIRKHYEELVDALTSSKPARESLAIRLFAKNVLNDLEKQEIMNDSGSAMKLADKLVGYIVSRIDSQQHCDNIWKGLDCVEALKDIVKKIGSERGKRSCNKLKKRI